MSRMDEDARDFARMLRYAADCIDYYYGMMGRNDCYDCPKEIECKYVPMPGDKPRINCPLREGGKEG